MQISMPAFALLLIIILLCVTVIYLLTKLGDSPKKTETTYNFSSPRIKNEYKLSNPSKFMLDPHELKLLTALMEQPDSTGLTVADVNQLLHLSKLSKENQRQRRHIIFKELNLKLFLVSGIRESIVRVSSEIDKRVKYYTLNAESIDIDIIKNIVISHS